MKKIYSVILLLFLTTGFLGSVARNIETHRGEIPRGYNFLFSPAPEDTVPTAKPLIVFLHGASLCGTNLERVRRYGPIDAIERGRHIDAHIVAPQNPGGGWKPSKVMEVIDYVKAGHDIDTTRIYVIGMSLGGYGTIDFAAAYPDKTAAAIAICGGGTSATLTNLNRLPLWIVHGTGDRAVNIVQSDNVVMAMRMEDNETPRLVYDRVPGMNHSEPARMFYMPEIYEWLFKHSLTDEDRPVHQPIRITRDGLRKAYDGLKSKGGKSTKKYTGKRKKKSRRRRR